MRLRFLHEADVGLAVKELCRKHGFSKASPLLAQQIWRDECS